MIGEIGCSRNGNRSSGEVENRPASVAGVDVANFQSGFERDVGVVVNVHSAVSVQGAVAGNRKTGVVIQG